jgi:hypothetical protein
MLLLVLTPDDLARKTHRAILEDARIENNSSLKIGGCDYRHQVMEDACDEDNQIDAKEGDIVVWDFVTYGYGEKISWAKLEGQKAELEEWAKGIGERHHCRYEIFVSANYW